MASKRMFSMEIVDDSAYVSMPSSTQNLYWHLNMRADDDGFVDKCERIARDVGSTIDDLNILLAKKFILRFDSGVVVIKHWRINNTLRKDRYKPTKYLEEKKQLYVRPDNAYTLNPQNGDIALENDLVASWLPVGCQMVTPVEVEDKELVLNKEDNLQLSTPVEDSLIVGNAHTRESYIPTYSQRQLLEKQWKSLNIAFYERAVNDIPEKHALFVEYCDIVQEWWSEEDFNDFMELDEEKFIGIFNNLLRKFSSKPKEEKAAYVWASIRDYAKQKKG